MTYQVLARKWRPRNFSTLVGQEHVVRALTHALNEQRLHHAYLFTGTRGVGKTTIARILAKSLNCESGVSASPCGKCSACTEIDAGRFVDLLEVDAATNTKVDEMRQLLENAIYAPTRGRYKVYVIDEVHMLSNSAFNAMLKTLEEPPEHVKFILATTDPQKIPVTVLSRCLQFNLKQMPSAAIQVHLANVLQAEGVKFDLAALALIARSAAGSMRDSLSLLDQAIAHGAGQVEEQQVRSMLGNVDQDHLFAILESLLESDLTALLRIAGELSLRSLSFSGALQELASLLVRIQLAQFAPATVGDDEADRDRLLAIASIMPPPFVQLAYQIILAGRAELALAPDEHAGFVMTLLRLHAFRPASVADLVTNARERTSIVAPVFTPSAASIPATAATSREIVNSSPAFDVAAGGRAESWQTMIAALPISGMVRELANNCELREISQEACTLRLPSDKSHLQMRPAQEKLQASLSEYCGRSLRLKIEVGDVLTDTPAEAADRFRKETQAAADASIAADGFVLEAAEILNASIMDASIKPLS